MVHIRCHQGLSHQVWLQVSQLALPEQQEMHWQQLHTPLVRLEQPPQHLRLHHPLVDSPEPVHHQLLLAA
jgi:hypothetical protein